MNILTNIHRPQTEGNVVMNRVKLKNLLLLQTTISTWATWQNG